MRRRTFIAGLGFAPYGESATARDTGDPDMLAIADQVIE
jgi:hypothetical protein